MTVIAMPASPVPRTVAWNLRQPTQVNRSEFTGRRKVTILGTAPRWTAKVTLPPIIGEPKIHAWRAFAVDCNGQANSFRVIACERDQIVGVTVRVAGAGQGGFAVVTNGWGGAGVKLRRGQFVTIADQLLMLMQDVVADDAGTATLRFKPFLRRAAANGAEIEVRRPYALMSMTGDEAGWVADVGQQYAVSFDCEESY
ncbi:hypothetical protein [Sphingomonas montana]|uniref:hypothetical protein n=1 Tax=Sphingomonas montana TaxID=1843236 RepID=UPI00101AECE6|nr:hypothetical protein [Sphingomonas montana]